MSLLDLINQQRAKLQKNTGNRSEKLGSEKNIVRILVNEVGGVPQLSQDWGQHWIKDQHGQLKAVYICTQTNFDEPCAVCEAIATGAAMTHDDDILKALKDSRSSRRILVNALYLKGGKHDNPETNPVVLELPPSVWDSILATAAAFAAEDINVFDPKEGHNFIIEKTGTGMATEYKVTPSPKQSVVNPEALTKIKDLQAWARQESESERAKAVTSVRAISGTVTIASGGMSAPTPRQPNKLLDVDSSVIDGDFVDVTPKPGSDDLEDFLRDL